MKRYFRRECTPDLGLGEGVVYVEYEGETATRQVERYQDQWYASDDPMGYIPELGPALTDLSLSDADFGPEHEITAEEFETVWELATRAS
jgi:hypothetical protein